METAFKLSLATVWQQRWVHHADGRERDTSISTMAILTAAAAAAAAAAATNHLQAFQAGELII